LGTTRASYRRPLRRTREARHLRPPEGARATISPRSRRVRRGRALPSGPWSCRDAQRSIRRTAHRSPPDAVTMPPIVGYVLLLPACQAEGRGFESRHSRHSTLRFLAPWCGPVRDVRGIPARSPTQAASPPGSCREMQGGAGKSRENGPTGEHTESERTAEHTGPPDRESGAIGGMDETTAASAAGEGFLRRAPL
jgi:hypothetical protein